MSAMFDYQPRLQGDVVALRPLLASDWVALHTLGSDPLVWALHPHPDRWMEPNFRAYFDDGLASGGALVVERRSDGAVVGWSRYSPKYVEPGEIEIGWTFIGRAHWGGPINGDMKQAMLTHAFRFVERVIFRIGEHNLRSRRAVEKLGARLTDRAQVTTPAESTIRKVFYALERRDFALRA